MEASHLPWCGAFLYSILPRKGANLVVFQTNCQIRSNVYILQCFWIYNGKGEHFVFD